MFSIEEMQAVLRRNDSIGILLSSINDDEIFDVNIRTIKDGDYIFSSDSNRCMKINFIDTYMIAVRNENGSLYLFSLLASDDHQQIEYVMDQYKNAEFMPLNTFLTTLSDNGLIYVEDKLIATEEKYVTLYGDMDLRININDPNIFKRSTVEAVNSADMIVPISTSKIFMYNIYPAINPPKFIVADDTKKAFDVADAFKLYNSQGGEYINSDGRIERVNAETLKCVNEIFTYTRHE